jgi:hypothetical protein
VAKLTTSDFKNFLKDNPEYGRALYEYLEDRRDQMLSQPWYSPDKYLGKRCQVIAEFLTADLMEEFNFKKYSRCD